MIGMSAAMAYLIDGKITGISGDPARRARVFTSMIENIYIKTSKKHLKTSQSLRKVSKKKQVPLLISGSHMVFTWLGEMTNRLGMDQGTINQRCAPQCLLFWCLADFTARNFSQ